MRKRGNRVARYLFQFPNLARTGQGSGVQHHSAANRHHRRKLPQDEAVARQQQAGFRKLELRMRRFSGPHLLLPVERDPRHGFTGMRMKMHAGSVFQSARRRTKQPQRHIRASSRDKRRLRRQRHPARQVLGARARQIQRGALAGNRRIGRLPVHLHATHANALARGKNFQHFIFAESFQKSAFRSRPFRIPSW